MKVELPNNLFQRLSKEMLGSDNFNVADEWERISKGNIKARYISPFSIILHENGVYPRIGRGTWIGHFTLIDGSQGLQIGESCDICTGVQIYTHSTHRRCVLGKPKEASPVEIGNNVFIGPNSIISLGCNIGNHCMVRGLSFLKPRSRFTPYSLIAGAPARRKRDVRVPSARAKGKFIQL